MKLTENDLIELSQIYNTAGRPAMTKVLKEKYQVKLNDAPFSAGRSRKKHTVMCFS